MKEKKKQVIPWFIVKENPKLKTFAILAKCKKLFLVRSDYNDKQLDEFFPSPTEATVRKFRPNIEADSDLANKSAEQCDKEGIQGITLRERLLLELQYFQQTNDHLDKVNVTICTGSRYPDGSVPSVHWCGGGLDVYGVPPQRADPGWRSRSAVFPSKLVISDLENRVAELEEFRRKVERIIKSE